MLKTAALVAVGAIFAIALSSVWHSAKIGRIEAKHASQIEKVKADAAAAQAKFTEALNETHAQTIKARADADRANDANRKLRQSLADYRARHANTTASAGQGEPDSDPIGVLADLLGRMGEAGERISRHADEVKIAGAACEKLSIN